MTKPIKSVFEDKKMQDDDGIERPKTKPPKPAHGHWYDGDLTLEQVQELFPLGATVRFFRGGGRLLGGMTGVVVGHKQGHGDPVTTRFGGKGELLVNIGAKAQAVADTIGAAIGFPVIGMPTQTISNPFNSCEVVSDEP